MGLRPYTRADASEVADVVNADAARTLGVTRAVVDAAGNVRLSRYVPPASEKVVVVDERDSVLGFAYLADRDQAVIAEVGGAVHPDAWRRGIGTDLVAWAEARAAALAESAPRGVRTVLQSVVFEAERPAAELLTKRGYRRVREWVHLLIELTAPPALPALPAGMRIRAMDLDTDWEVVGPAMEEAYADHWGTIPPLPSTPAPEHEAADEPQDPSYSNSPGFCFVLESGETVVGGVLCNARLVERPDTGRVGSMFVRPRFRRQGLGRALMLAAFAAFWQQGIRRIVLDTDAESFTQAPLFYGALGMREFRREVVYEKEIRPGREVRRLGPYA